MRVRLAVGHFFKSRKLVVCPVAVCRSVLALVQINRCQSSEGVEGEELCNPEVAFCAPSAVFNKVLYECGTEKRLLNESANHPTTQPATFQTQDDQNAQLVGRARRKKKNRIKLRKGWFRSLVLCNSAYL